MYVEQNIKYLNCLDDIYQTSHHNLVNRKAILWYFSYENTE